MITELAMIGAEPEEDETPGEQRRYYDFLVMDGKLRRVLWHHRENIFFTRGSFEDAAKNPPRGVYFSNGIITF
jgi:hypothetical protein